MKNLKFNAVMAAFNAAIAGVGLTMGRPLSALNGVIAVVLLASIVMAPAQR